MLCCLLKRSYQVLIAVSRERCYPYRRFVSGRLWRERRFRNQKRNVQDVKSWG